MAYMSLKKYQNVCIECVINQKLVINILINPLHEIFFQIKNYYQSQFRWFMAILSIFHQPFIREYSKKSLLKLRQAALLWYIISRNLEGSFASRYSRIPRLCLSSHYCKILTRDILFESCYENPISPCFINRRFQTEIIFLIQT